MHFFKFEFIEFYISSYILRQAHPTYRKTVSQTGEFERLNFEKPNLITSKINLQLIINQLN
jgi:hypothetical protein